MKKIFRRFMLAMSLAMATVGAHAAGLVIGVAEDGTMGKLDLAELKSEMTRRVAQRDMTVPAQVAVVRIGSTGEARPLGGFDGSCSLVAADRFRDGGAEQQANDATRDLMRSASALVRVADQQRVALQFVALCLVTDRPQDYVSLLKLPPPGLVARAVDGMAYLVLAKGVLMFTL